MSLLEKYKEIREIQVRLHTKILEKCVSKDDFNKANEILGVIRNNKIVLESHYEKDVIFEFNVYGNIKNGKNAVSEYIEKEVEADLQEVKLLKAMQKSDNLLYEVKGIEKEKGIIILKGVIKDTDFIKVIDIGMSSSLRENMLVFTRLIDLDDFSMTSGLGFCFSIDHKQYLINRSRKLMKKVNSGDTSVDRFIAFFNLNRSDGLPTLFEKV